MLRWRFPTQTLLHFHDGPRCPVKNIDKITEHVYCMTTVLHKVWSIHEWHHDSPLLTQYQYNSAAISLKIQQINHKTCTQWICNLSRQPQPSMQHPQFNHNAHIHTRVSSNQSTWHTGMYTFTRRKGPWEVNGTAEHNYINRIALSRV